MIGFIDDRREAHGVEPICKVLPIAPSTYYDHVARRRDPARLSARAKRDMALKVEVRRVYDNELRKKTGSYYTPPEVVRAMVRLVDEALRSDQRFGLSEGLASPDVTVADPATGTGTFLLGVLRRIAEATEADQGPGAVPGVVEAALSRLVGFELQFGPFAVAQLRLLAELQSLLDDPNATPAMRLFVTDTLGNPYAEEEYIPQILMPLGESRRHANEIKRQEKITVVVGNPPYKEKAKGLGGWIESGTTADVPTPPLGQWMPPTDWNVGAHTKHLRNLYVYFWRWATWKVFGDGAPSRTEGRAPDRKGIVSFITVAGFLDGPGFQKMRADLRSDADEIWVIDCSPEGHQPEVRTRIFQGAQQPVCIVMALRNTDTGSPTPARVRYRALPLGHRDDKFAALGAITLDDSGWTECSFDSRASFFPRAAGAWLTLRLLRIYLATMAPASCRAGPGLSPLIVPRLSVGGRLYRLKPIPGRRKSCFIHIFWVVNRVTNTPTRYFVRDFTATSSAPAPLPRTRAPSFDLFDTVSALSIGSGSSLTGGSLIGRTRRFGRTIRAGRYT